MISTSICTIVQFTMCYIVYCIMSLVYISADTMCTLAQTQANQRTQEEQKKKQKKQKEEAAEEAEEAEEEDKDTKRKIGTARKTKEPAFPLSSAASPLLYSTLLYSSSLLYSRLLCPLPLLLSSFQYQTRQTNKQGRQPFFSMCMLKSTATIPHTPQPT